MKIRTYFIVAILLILFPLTAFTEEVYFYHTDNFGTPMVMTDINGEVVWRSDELPFGEELEPPIESPIKNNRRYLGKEMDEETGFIYMGSRYLNPATGQFNRPDPVGLVDPATGKVNQEMLLNPQRLNRYAYGLNNPYRYVDPDGEFAFVGAALIGAAIAYFSHPDVANAPESFSSPTYESHGGRNIVIGAVGGAGLGKIATMGSVATSQATDSGPTTTLYHGGNLNRPNKPNLSTTTNRAHAAQYAKDHGGKVHSFEIPTRRLYKLESQQRVFRVRDSKHGTNSIGKEFRFNRDAVKHLKKK